MKNKVLSYLLGWLLALNIFFWYVIADCADQCKGASDPTSYTTCMANCNQQQQQWWGWGGWWECNWIKLNTNFPIIWNCIWDNEDVTKTFPSMVWALTKIVMSLILVVCFILVIVAWIMRAGDNPWQWKWWWAKWLLAKVAITILLLWFSWVILKLINPNFFVS